MKRTINFLLCLISIFGMAAIADAATKPPKGKKKGTPPPVASATPAASSAELSSFMSAHLETILGPLGPKVDAPRAQLAQIRDGFAKAFSKASLADRQKFQLGLNACDAISDAMNERTKAAAIQASATWPQKAAALRQKIDALAAQQKAAEAH